MVALVSKLKCPARNVVACACLVSVRHVGSWYPLALPVHKFIIMAHQNTESLHPQLISNDISLESQ